MQDGTNYKHGGLNYTISKKKLIIIKHSLLVITIKCLITRVITCYVWRMNSKPSFFRQFWTCTRHNRRIVWSIFFFSLTWLTFFSAIKLSGIILRKHNNVGPAANTWTRATLSTLNQKRMNLIIFRRHFQTVGAEHVSTKMFQKVKRNTKHNRLQQNTEIWTRTHTVEEKVDVGEEGDGFSQLGSKVAETNLWFPHQSGLSLSPWFLKQFAQS